MIDVSQRIAALEQLKEELDKDRKRVEILAPDDDYKAGYKKAMTNVFAVINEEIRITKQFGDKTIHV